MTENTSNYYSSSASAITLNSLYNSLNGAYNDEFGSIDQWAEWHATRWCPKHWPKLSTNRNSITDHVCVEPFIACFTCYHEFGRMWATPRKIRTKELYVPSVLLQRSFHSGLSIGKFSYTYALQTTLIVSGILWLMTIVFDLMANCLIAINIYSISFGVNIFLSMNHCWLLFIL